MGLDQQVEVPISIYFCDAYLRLIIETTYNIDIDDWGNVFFQKLNKSKPLIKKKLIDGVKKYFRRIHYSVKFDPPTQINDNYSQYVKIIYNAINFVNNTPKYGYKYPFQFDIWIIPDSVVDTNNKKKKIQRPKGLQNIEELLKKKHKRINITNLISYNRDSTNLHCNDNYSHYLFNQPLQKLLRLANINKNSEIQNNRIICIHDRKKELMSNNKNNTFMFIENTQKNSQISKDIFDKNRYWLSYSYYQNSRQFLLPKEPTNGVNKMKYGARDDCDGYMFCISFHIIAENDIKAYLYSNSTICRVEPTVRNI